MSALHVAWSSGRRACSAAMAAPALHDLWTDSAISSGWVGRLGVACLDAMPPVGATVTMTLPFDAIVFSVSGWCGGGPAGGLRGGQEAQSLGLLGRPGRRGLESGLGLALNLVHGHARQIGRASCRER